MITIIRTTAREIRKLCAYREIKHQRHVYFCVCYATFLTVDSGVHNDRPSCQMRESLRGVKGLTGTNSRCLSICLCNQSAKCEAQCKDGVKICFQRSYLKKRVQEKCVREERERERD